ncbi:MAG: glycosyltransferase [Bacteroidetes bacterium]|nr:glycosyltransferase [Bacteroidota bacterium]
MQIFTCKEPKSLIKYHKSQVQPVSIIICAKNEAHNLQRNLPSILAQRYTNEAGNAMYEVIVVNDASTDATDAVLAELERQNANLRVISIKADEEHILPGKKFALSKAVTSAKYGVLLLTDADCMPATSDWLKYMVEPINSGKEIVAGYGKYTEQKGILNRFIRWETMHTFLQYSSYTKVGRPYMATGRNLACTKASLLHAQQSPIWSELPSGDDDLLIRYAATSTNMEIVKWPEAFTLSEPKLNITDWIKQKQRHVSTGKYYKISIKLLLGLYALTHALSWMLFFILLFLADWQTVVIAMGGRCLCYWLLWTTNAKQLGEKRLTIFLPVADIAWAIYNFVFSPYIFFKNKQQWK